MRDNSILYLLLKDKTLDSIASDLNYSDKNINNLNTHRNVLKSTCLYRSYL